MKREFIVPIDYIGDPPDNEEIIRCKDCKYNDDGECIIKAGWFPVKPEWFCADGKRKDI